ncbi:MAG: VWA domain-containing protein [Gemmatales bacterium]|nr:VWA domain-containing protein [Gemmatales bacterium]MDW8223216.1 vWA domain-containing protein [Gemmatales bacterium]
MPYDAEISRTNPSCFLFLIDQSGSMSDNVGGSPETKAQALARVINELLMNLCIRCTVNPREGIRYYYDVGVLGYGRNNTVSPALEGALADRELIPIPEIANNPLRIHEVEQNGRLRRFPIWLEPVADNGTPMCEALRVAYAILEPWVTQHPNSFPPTVINITDGQPTDGDPLPEAQRIQQLTTKDGNVLMFNVHISETTANPIYYPDDESRLPDDYARMLFRMSSALPSHMVQAAQQERMPVTSASRGFVFNANMSDVIRFLNIGTRPKKLR